MHSTLSRGLFVVLILLSFGLPSWSQRTVPVPGPLQEWREWVMWDHPERLHPPHYNEASERPGLWPSRLVLEVNATSGRFSLAVTTYSETWVGLPGDATLWPQGVTAGGRPVPVTPRQGLPAVRLPAGTWVVTGAFAWTEVPQRIQLPPNHGFARPACGRARG